MWSASSGMSTWWRLSISYARRMGRETYPHTNPGPSLTPLDFRLLPADEVALGINATSTVPWVSGHTRVGGHELALVALANCPDLPDSSYFAGIRSPAPM